MMNEEMHDLLLKELAEARRRVAMIGEMLAHFAAAG